MPSVTTAPRPRTQAPRTLWEEGRHPGRLVVSAAIGILALATALSLLVGDRIGVFFDLVFVLTCIAAALAVRPRDFFTIGVLPPLLLAATVLLLALVDRGAVARADDSLVQALVSGLAHHALALVLGYGLALAVLALRQVALRHEGRLRRGPARPTATVPVQARRTPATASPEREEATPGATSDGSPGLTEAASGVAETEPGRPADEPVTR